MVFLNGTNTIVTGDSEAVEILSAGKDCTIAAVSDKFLEELKSDAKSIGTGLREVGKVNGLNYSAGREVEIVVFTSI